MTDKRRVFLEDDDDHEVSLDNGQIVLRHNGYIYASSEEKGLLVMTEDELGEKIQETVDGELAHLQIMLKGEVDNMEDGDHCYMGMRLAIERVNAHRDGTFKAEVGLLRQVLKLLKGEKP